MLRKNLLSKVKRADPTSHGEYQLWMGPHINSTSYPSHWQMNTNWWGTSWNPHPSCGPDRETLGSKIPFGLGRNSRGRTSKMESPHHCLIKQMPPLYGRSNIHESGGPMRNHATHTMALGGGNSQKVSIPIEYPLLPVRKKPGDSFRPVQDLRESPN